MIDYTKLRQKLNPETQIGGDPGLQIRVGVIQAIASDGTVTLTLSGVNVPGVSVLNGAIFAVGSVVQVLSFRGSMLVLGTSGNGDYAERTIVKSGDQTWTANATLADVTGFNFSAQPNARYEYRMYVCYSGTAASDVKLAWTTPAGGNMARYITAPQAAGADNQNTAVSMIRRSPATAQVAGAMGTGSEFTVWREDGLATTGAAGGIFQVQFAQNAASGSAQFKGDSYMVVRRIPA